MKTYSYLQHKPTLSPKSRIFPGAIVTGDVILGDDVSVWFNAVIRGDMSLVTILEKTNIQDHAMIHTNTDKPTYIGKNCTIGHRAIIHACTIGNDVLIGMGSIILDGVIIGDGAMIGAGTVVPPNKVIPPKMLAYGNPMMITRQLTKEELAANRKNAVKYVEMMNNYVFEEE
jgi:carbonic anhydrase/acetyltransferase-like protein (isoleucine patch superfamily)